MALFLIVAMIVSSQVAMRNLATEGRRERETDMIWRGNQYVRAIRVFYHKAGHYPQSLDDLKKGLPDLHFLRAVTYKDPMNRDDGDWRLIYVNASGQIIGSVRYASLQQMALIDLNGGTLPASQGSTGGGSAESGSSDTNSQQAGPQAGQSSSSSPSNASTMAGSTLGQAANQFGGIGQGSNALGQAKPTGPVDGPVFGAFVGGVASKVDRPSLKVYKGGTTYLQWEFIWNPLEDQARAIQNGLAPQGQQPGMPGIPVASPDGGTAPVPPPPPNTPSGTEREPDEPQEQ
jgi:hypothetical protein